jgi:hypothetical protein
MNPKEGPIHSPLHIERQWFSGSVHYNRNCPAFALNKTPMNLIEAIILYSHTMIQAGGGLDGRRAAKDALTVRGVPEVVIDEIAQAIEGDGHIFGSDGSRYAITQIAKS